MSALTLAQAAAGDGLDTGTVVAVVGAVLAALVSVFGLRMGARLDAIEKGQDGLASALERLERRLDDGLARLTDRLDHLYGSAPRSAEVEAFERREQSLRRARAAREDEPNGPPGEAP